MCKIGKKINFKKFIWFTRKWKKKINFFGRFSSSRKVRKKLNEKKKRETKQILEWATAQLGHDTKNCIVT